MFLPREDATSRAIFFAEVQFQKAESAVLGSPQVEQLSKTDEALYHRVATQNALISGENCIITSQVADKYNGKLQKQAVGYGIRLCLANWSTHADYMTVF